MFVPLTVACVTVAAAAFGVADQDLWTILEVEGGQVGECCAQPDANGHRQCGRAVVPGADCGAFQINERAHGAEFARIFGTSREQAMERLRDDGCLSAYAAAFVLAQKTRQGGGDRTEGVGRYHSATPALKEAYLRRIAKARTRLFGER